MKIENKFYIGKAESQYLVHGYYYDVTTGEYADNQDSFIMLSIALNNAKRLKVETFFHNFNEDRVCILFWDKNNEYLGFQDSQLSIDGVLECDVPYNNASYFGFCIIKENYSGSTASREIKVYLNTPVRPHYKQLKKKYAKENNQMFFRESLDGKINLFGIDYLLVKNASLEDTLFFYIYRGETLFISASFNKSNCKFDHFKKSVELKLTYNDKYSKILDAYENTYDMVKLAPALTPITLTKRCVVQIYIQGENVLSNYAGGTYWETQVDEQIDDQDLLLNKYYFSKGPKYVEVDLQGFNYDINAAYRAISSNNIWNAVSKKEVDGQIYKAPCSIKFNKVYNADYPVPKYMQDINILTLSDGTGEGTYHDSEGKSMFKYDTYRIEIHAGKDGDGPIIYQSDKLYGKDANFSLAAGRNLYPMTKISQSITQPDPTPSTFNLGECVIEYQIWGRLLCDVDKVPNGKGEMVDTHDLPHDDFATPRRNYRKCIGLRDFDSSNSVITIWQNEQSIEEPTSYGINDFGEYFTPPYTLWGQYFYPLARNSWANVSLWVRLGRGNSEITSFENYCAECYKEYSVKNTYHIGDAIKALLAKIDPSVTHEKTAEYSSFLYSHSGGTASALGDCDIYITQKTNILKGEYDQAAQKAEIKFKQLMDMLRDCFRCFWYIDEQNRFRIEHISYFMNGLSYNNPKVQLDLTKKRDKFNKKAVLYCQREVEYDKADLTSRYEFKYMDDVTKAMGGDFYIDVNNAYIKKDRAEEINVDGFTADIDYMLFLPDDFSNDGFALLLAHDGKVPIINQKIKDEKQNNHEMEVYVQNWYASFNNLAQHYMEDISGDNISYNNISFLYPGHTKRCVKHDVEFYTDELVNAYELITSDIGGGYVEEITVDVDTNITSVELRYNPN